MVPLLRKQAVAFLHQSAAGKPLIALKLAEDFQLADVYKVRSYVVDDKACGGVDLSAVGSPLSLYRSA